MILILFNIFLYITRKLKLNDDILRTCQEKVIQNIL